MHYYLRQATTEDLELLDKIHTENMKAYVENIYPWQPRLFVDNFLASDYQVIETDNLVIGMIKTIASKDEIYLAEIQITSKYQNQGIGSKIIRDLTNQAKINNQRLWLKVIKNNPAIKLYERLGFTIFEQNQTHLKFELNCQTKYKKIKRERINQA